MEQISYDFEVVINLLRKENHLRGLAKDLGINHMTVKRATGKLIKENIIDVRILGKNNIFSIKKTIEARNKILMSEYYKLNKLLSKHPKLRKNIEQLMKLETELIIIFGSYAKGTETKNSDIDLYLQTTNTKIRNEAKNINPQFSVKIGEYDLNNLLIKEIIKNHVIIKGVEKFYEKNKFLN